MRVQSAGAEGEGRRLGLVVSLFAVQIRVLVRRGRRTQYWQRRDTHLRAALQQSLVSRQYIIQHLLFLQTPYTVLFINLEV